MIVSGMNASSFGIGMNVSDLYNMSRNSYARPEIKQADQVGVSSADGAVNIKNDSVNVAISDNAASSSDSNTSDSFTRRETLSSKEATEFTISKIGVDRNLVKSYSDIETLDVQRAVSDMQADSMIKHYQYFVGNLNNEDGQVIRK